jgi:Ca2+-binding EF-hand superfamily protein
MHRKPAIYGLAVAALAVALSSSAAEDAKSEFDRRAAERYVSLFQALDLDNDRMVSRAEARGDLNFAPMFDDMDINRDGYVTAEELQRFIAQRYGMPVVFGR